MIETAEKSLEQLQAQIHPFLEQQLEEINRRLGELERELHKVQARLNEVELKGLEIISAIRMQKHKANEIRHKIKKHGKLLAEIDPKLAPHEYRQLSEERTALEMELPHALQELERLREQYDAILSEEDTLIGQEWDLEQEADDLRVRYTRLLKQISRLAQAIERRVRDIQAKHH